MSAWGGAYNGKKDAVTDAMCDWIDSEDRSESVLEVAAHLAECMKYALEGAASMENEKEHQDV